LAKIVIFSQLAKDLKIENRKVLKIMLPLVKKAWGFSPKERTLFRQRAHPFYSFLKHQVNGRDQKHKGQRMIPF
jgi:hypothetical protein